MKGSKKLYYLKTEIEDIEEEIKSLEELSSKGYGFSKGGAVSNPTEQFVIKKNHLIEKLREKIEEYIAEIERITNIVNVIEDDEIRLIARLRYVDNKEWEEIGRRLNLDRSVCSKKLKKYLEKEKVEI